MSARIWHRIVMMWLIATRPLHPFVDDGRTLRCARCGGSSTGHRRRAGTGS